MHYSVFLFYSSLNENSLTFHCKNNVFGIRINTLLDCNIHLPMCYSVKEEHSISKVILHYFFFRSDSSLQYPKADYKHFSMNINSPGFRKGKWNVWGKGEQGTFGSILGRCLLVCSKCRERNAYCKGKKGSMSIIRGDQSLLYFLHLSLYHSFLILNTV